MDIDLVYFEGCPNVAKARERLMTALDDAGILPEYREWRDDDPESPEHVQGWGSPTILVNGHDLIGETQNPEASNCRVYETPDGKLDGAPPVELITAALLSDASCHEPARKLSDKGRWAGFLTLFPAIGAALLPTCPACWPLYAGVFASFGIEFAEGSPLVAPLIITFLLIALASLAYRADRRRGYGPFFLGVAGTVLVLISKFAIVSGWLLHGGVAFMLGAFVWNVWPRKDVNSDNGNCPACVPKGNNPY